MRSETRHTIVLTAGSGVAALFALVYTVYAGRVLGPASYADFTSAVALLSLFTITMGPINSTVARFASIYAVRQEYGRIRTLAVEVLRRVGLAGLVGLAIGTLAISPLTQALHFHSWLITAVVFVTIYLTFLLNVGRGLLRGMQRYNGYSANAVLEALARLTGGVVLVVMFGSAVAAASAYLIAVIVSLGVSLVQLRDLGQHDREPVDGSAIKRFAVPMFISAFCAAATQNVDMLQVKSCFGETEAGIYGAAVTLGRGTGVFAMPFTTLVLPLLTAMYEQKQSIIGTFLRICTYFVLVAAGPVTVLYIWTAPIVDLLYGQAYAHTAVIIMPLVISFLVGALTSLIGQAFASMNDFRYLWVCGAGLGAQIIGVAAWHDDLLQVAHVVLATKAATTVVLGIMFACNRRVAPR